MKQLPLHHGPIHSLLHLQLAPTLGSSGESEPLTTRTLPCTIIVFAHGKWLTAKQITLLTPQLWMFQKLPCTQSLPECSDTYHNRPPKHMTTGDKLEF